MKINLLIDPGARLNNNCEEEVANSEVFMKSMRAFGQSFLQPDIAVFRYIQLKT